MDQWLTARGMPGITVVEYRDMNGARLTLEQECLRSGTLPSRFDLQEVALVAAFVEA